MPHGEESSISLRTDQETNLQAPQCDFVLCVFRFRTIERLFMTVLQCEMPTAV